jgi:hypothetical protein
MALLAPVALFGCEQRFSADPPVGPESFAPASSSSSAIDALIAPAPTSAASAVDVSHALVVTLCSASPKACPPSDADASTEGSYHVVFGSGRGALRSRGQAMADLYKELRDRTKSGEQLDAETHAQGEAGWVPPAAGGPSVTPRSSGDDGDPLAACASHLLDLVDGTGEVSLDVVHGFSKTACTVSLGRSTSDAGAPLCLVKAPEQPHRPGRR